MRIRAAFVAGAMCRSLPAVTPYADVSSCCCMGGGVEREGNLLLRPASARRNCPAPMTHPRAYITLSPSRVYSVLLSPVALALAL